MPGPIPAGAGEPFIRQSGRSLARAYPRRSGGTNAGDYASAALEGLSPQERGNRFGGASAPFFEGPIPAGAGEPP